MVSQVSQGEPSWPQHALIQNKMEFTWPFNGATETEKGPNISISTKGHRPSYLAAAGATFVLVYLAHVLPDTSTVICARSSCPLAQAPPAPAALSWPPVNATSWIPLAPQFSARKCVPLKPTQARTGATRSGRKPLLKLRWTRSAGVPLMVVGVSWRSAAVLTQAASTISPAMTSSSSTPEIHARRGFAHHCCGR